MTPYTFDDLPRHVGIVGSRHHPRLDAVAKYVSKLKPDTVVVSGTDPNKKKRENWGVDEIAVLAARTRGLEVVLFEPDWNGPLGRGAGFARNSEIVAYLDERYPDCYIAAFNWEKAPGQVTGGTRDTITKALKAGVPYTIYHWVTWKKQELPYWNVTTNWHEWDPSLLAALEAA